MKKSKLIILCIAVATVILAVVIITLLSNKQKEITNAPKGSMIIQADVTDVEEFDYDLFENVINNSRYSISNVNVGQITGAEAAKEKADKFINEYFSVDIQEGKQLLVSYNKDKDLWFIQCFRGDLTGGFYDVVINTNGDVIAAWHSQ